MKRGLKAVRNYTPFDCEREYMPYGWSSPLRRYEHVLEVALRRRVSKFRFCGSRAAAGYSGWAYLWIGKSGPRISTDWQSLS